jgi:hypothetical protein
MPVDRNGNNLFLDAAGRAMNYPEAMSASLRNPAAEWFVDWCGDERVIGQVLVCRRGQGYELRHIADRDASVQQLREASAEEVRTIAQFTEEGAFRPLKSAPTLRRGWRIATGSDAELAAALDRLYPGAIADLFATLQHPPPATDYREFTNRQSGMYRITALLDESQAGAMVMKCCAAQFCLKRRFWDAGGFAPEIIEQKSVIPCLEPCAILLEFARKVVRASQQQRLPPAEVLMKLEPISRGADETGE